jgi:hypothetical protein
MTELKDYTIYFDKSDNNFLICDLKHNNSGSIYRCYLTFNSFTSNILNINNIENIIRINSNRTQNFYTIEIKSDNDKLLLTISYLNDFLDYEETFIFSKSYFI